MQLYGFYFPPFWGDFFIKVYHHVNVVFIGKGGGTLFLDWFEWDRLLKGFSDTLGVGHMDSPKNQMADWL